MVTDAAEHSQSDVVLIFRYEVLPASETFIISQARALRRYRPFFAGIERSKAGLHIAELESETLIAGDSAGERIKRRIFLHTGRARDFYGRLTKKNPCLIHAHFGPDGAIALPLSKQLNVPLAVTLHG